MSDAAPWGRVADDGTVYVRTHAGERAVGQWPGGNPDEAMAFYVRRYQSLHSEVELLVRRLAAGTIPPPAAERAIATLRETVSDAQAVGDLDALLRRLDELQPLLAASREARRAAKAKRLAEAATAKDEIATAAERIAGGSDWRRGGEQLSALLDRWKALPRLDKGVDDPLWARFSAARTAYAKARKRALVDRNERQALAAETKQTLVARAEVLAASTDWGSTTRAFRDLMAAWKSAGPAPRGVEDRLWARFRAAQDGFFSARDKSRAAEDASLAANAVTKRAILAEAEALLPVTDPGAARTALHGLAERWEGAGKVPKDQVRSLEGGMRAVEDAIRRAEQERWSRSNPEAQARASSSAAQLEAALVRLRTERSAAVARGDERAAAEAEAAITARESWLAPIQEFLRAN